MYEPVLCKDMTARSPVRLGDLGRPFIPAVAPALHSIYVPGGPRPASSEPHQGTPRKTMPLVKARMLTRGVYFRSWTK